MSARIVANSGWSAFGEQSLCLAVADADPSVLQRLARIVLFRFAFGVGGIVLAPLLGIFGPRIGILSGNDWALLAIAVGGGGFWLLFTFRSRQRRFVRRHLGRRFNDLDVLGDTHSPTCVAIENAATFDRFKVVAEDVGYLWFDPTRQKLLIEGLLYRYVILNQDVVSVRKIVSVGGAASVIEYMIGGKTLALAVQHDSLNGAFHGWICDALQGS